MPSFLPLSSNNQPNLCIHNWLTVPNLHYREPKNNDHLRARRVTAMLCWQCICTVMLRLPLVLNVLPCLVVALPISVTWLDQHLLGHMCDRAYWLPHWNILLSPASTSLSALLRHSCIDWVHLLGKINWTGPVLTRQAADISRSHLLIDDSSPIFWERANVDAQEEKHPPVAIVLTSVPPSVEKAIITQQGLTERSTDPGSRPRHDLDLDFQETGLLH